MKKPSGPITITADSLQADSKAGRALFQGHVVAKSSDMTLYADKMLVLYGSQGGIDEIDAEGGIKLIKAGKIITSDKARYVKAEDKVVFTGSPKVAEGKTVINGSRITYYVAADRMAVSDSKVFIESK